MIFIVPDEHDEHEPHGRGGSGIWGCGLKGAVTPFTSEADIQQRTRARHQASSPRRSRPGGLVQGKANARAAISWRRSSPRRTRAAPSGSSPRLVRHEAHAAQRARVPGVRQTKAFYADSTADTFDKKNVRDGHYVVWGPSTSSRRPTRRRTPSRTRRPPASSLGQRTTATTAFNYIQIEAKAGIVPQCAMKVTRSADGGYLSAYTPAAPCGCFYESVTTNTAVPTGCTACTSDTPAVRSTASTGSASKEL